MRTMLRSSLASLAPRHTPQNLKWKWTKDLRPELKFANATVSIAPTAQYPRLKKAGLPHPSHAMFPSRYPVTLSVQNVEDPRRDFMRLNKHVAGLGMPRAWRFGLFHLALGSRNNIEVQRWLGRVWWLRLERLAKYFLFMSKVELARGIRKEHLLRGKIRHAMAIPRTQTFAEVAIPPEYQWRTRSADAQNISVQAQFQAFAPLVDLDTTTQDSFVVADDLGDADTSRGLAGGAASAGYGDGDVAIDLGGDQAALRSVNVADSFPTPPLSER